MAIIRCEHCGHHISDKAPFCPKCGYLRVIAISEENLKPRGYSVPPTSNAPLKTPKGLWAMGIIGLLIWAGGIVGLVPGIHNRHEQYLNELEYLRLERLRIEEHQRLEMIAAEQAHLDSISQDSIKRRNFESPDLAFNELHGDVKDYKFDEIVFSYNEDGLIDPSWNARDISLMRLNKQTSLPEDKITRDNEGKIIKVWEFTSYDGNYGEFYNIDYIWDGERAIPQYDSKNHREYDENGLLIGYAQDKDYDIQPERIVYTDYVLDGLGNWIERRANIFTYEPDDMNAFDYPIVKKSIKEKRTIIYYKSDGSQRTKLENSTRQNELLKKEQQLYYNAEKKYNRVESY